MKMNKDTKTLIIPDMQAVPLPQDISGIICRRGSAWVTAKGSRTDLVLKKNEQATLENMEKICVQGIGETEIILLCTDNQETMSDLLAYCR